jgi:hypothetical protein
MSLKLLMALFRGNLMYQLVCFMIHHKSTATNVSCVGYTANANSVAIHQKHPFFHYGYANLASFL